MRVLILLATLALASGQFFYYPQNSVFQHPVVSPYHAQNPGAVFFQPSVQAPNFAPKFRFATTANEDTPTATYVDAPAAAVPVSAFVPATLGVARANVYHNFHSQDNTGAYSYGYSGGPSSKHEIRDSFGNVHGAFNYVDPEGNIQSQRYVADAGGFRVAATNLPQAPVAPVAAPLEAPQPVKETPEVALARAEHNRLFNAAAEAAAATKTQVQTRKRRSADPDFAYSTTYTKPAAPFTFYNTFGSFDNFKDFPAATQPLTYRADTVSPTTGFVQPLTYRADTVSPFGNVAPTTGFVQPLTYNAINFPTVSSFPNTHFVNPLTYSAAVAPHNFVNSPFFHTAFPFTFRAAQTSPVTYSKVVHSPGEAETIIATN